MIDGRGTMRNQESYLSAPSTVSLITRGGVGGTGWRGGLLAHTRSGKGMPGSASGRRRYHQSSAFSFGV